MDLNDALDAGAYLNEKAMADAQESTQRLLAGRPRSRLEGIPLLVKDNLVVREMPAPWGSRLYAGRVADHDELPVELLRESGSIIVGETNYPELTAVTRAAFADPHLDDQLVHSGITCAWAAAISCLERRIEEGLTAQQRGRPTGHVRALRCR